VSPVRRPDSSELLQSIETATQKREKIRAADRRYEVIEVIVKV
jgi:hypothetical protein